MAFDLENGYQPRTFDEILEAVVESVNEQFGTTYDSETIVGTEHYKFAYAGIQQVMLAESYIAQITAQMTDYIRTANENINLPKSTVDGFTAGLKRSVAEGGLGLDSTIKNITDDEEAGHLFCVVDVDDEAEDYEDTKQEILEKMIAWLGAGLLYEGEEAGTVTISNGQVFDCAFDLPTPVDILVRITVTISANTQSAILNENQVRDIFNENFAASYRLGLDFEPERYLGVNDLPFASDILLEYSEDDGSNWSAEPRSMAYNEKINITEPATITIE